MVNGKYRYNSWSVSVSLIPFVSSSSNEPISNASAAFTSPRGGINGGVYFCIYTWCQSIPAKNGCSLISSAPRPRHPKRLSTSRISRPSSKHFSSLLNESGSSTFCKTNWEQMISYKFKYKYDWAIHEIVVRKNIITKKKSIKIN